MAADTTNLVAGTCRFCRCQEHTPCEGGCAWTDDTQTLCTTCLAAASMGMELVRALGIVSADPKVGLHIAAAADWDGLTLAQQAVIVTTCRRWLETAEMAIAAEFGEEVHENAEQLDAIAAFLLEHAGPELARPEETIATVVIRLLSPHVGSRIVLPAGASR